MTFTELSKSTEQHLPNYYETLLSHHALIITEVGKTSKNAVSKALNIHPTKFSTVYSCILAYSNLVAEEVHITSDINLDLKV